MRSSLTVDRPQPSPQSHHSHSLTWEAEVKRMSTNLHPHHSRTAASPWLSATITIYTAVVRSQPIYSRCTITPTKIAPVNKFILNHHVYDILKFYMYCFVASAATRDHSKFSEYGSARFSYHQNNFSGNYATFEENKKSLDTLTKTLSRRHETYTEKTVDKLLSQILANTKRRSQSIDQVISSKPPPPPPHVIVQQQALPEMTEAIRPVKVNNSEYQCEFIDKWSEQKQTRANFENVKSSSPNHTVYESLETFGKTDESSLSKIPTVDCSVASVNTNSASRTTNESRTTTPTSSKVEINLASLNRQTVSNQLTYLADKENSLNRPLHISSKNNGKKTWLTSATFTKFKEPLL